MNKTKVSVIIVKEVKSQVVVNREWVVLHFIQWTRTVLIACNWQHRYTSGCLFYISSNYRLRSRQSVSPSKRSLRTVFFFLSFSFLWFSLDCIQFRIAGLRYHYGEWFEVISEIRNNRKWNRKCLWFQANMDMLIIF